MGNFLKANTTDTSAYYGAQGDLNRYAQQVADNTVALGIPETADLDPNYINKVMRDYAAINRLQSRADERMDDPRAAAAREAFEKEISEGATDQALNPAVQRELARAGITSAVNTGAGLGAGSVGQSQMANIMGRGYEAYRRGKRDEARGLFGDSAQQTGLDASQAGTLAAGGRQQKADAINTGRQTMQNVANTMLQNQYGQYQQTGQAVAQQAQNNAAAKNQAMGQTVGAISKIAGSAMSSI